MAEDLDDIFHLGTVRFGLIRNQDQVAAVVQAIRQNEQARSLSFDFNDYIGDMLGRSDWRPLDWRPLLNELDARANLEKVTCSGPTGRLLPLVHDQFFQALQHNSNVRSLKLKDVNITSNNSQGVVSFLDGAQGLTDLSLEGIHARNQDDLRNLAAALQRNTRIHTLSLSSCHTVVICSVFQHLASIHSASRLLNLSCYFLTDRKSGPEALQQYLESASATVNSLELINLYVNGRSCASKIIRGLIQNTSVTELAFQDCSIATAQFRAVEQTEEVKEEHARLLASLFRRQAALSSLHLSGYHNFFRYPSFSDAVVDVLVQRGSSLRRLDVDIMFAENGSANMSLPIFQALMSAICRSTMLEHLRIGNIRTDVGGYYEALREGISSLKVRELSLRFLHETTGEDEEGLLAALKNNYLVQRVDCNWSTDAYQNQLSSYLDRNHKLAQWIANPKLVPCELWSYAVMLAVKAGINSLYQRA